MHSLDDLNAATPDAFAAMLEGVFEHAPWVAQATAAARPFATVTALHEALMATVSAVPQATLLGFLNGHPPLARGAFADPALTVASRDEQAGLALDALGAGYDRFAALSAAYAARFGFPFIICVRRHTAASVVRTLESRLAAGREEEVAASLAEIGLISRLRLVARVGGPGMPRCWGHLSTHVLDTARGRPAEGVAIELFREGVVLARAVTDRRGRTPQALIEGEPLRIGGYELRFHIGAYFAGWSPPVADPAWYDVIPVCFSIAEPEGDYHIPLLAAPWQYTTYRGS
jgi:2-oxo-4-hydroxy-4-carboxy-5-ureidoimidazoline decarboxylase